MGSECPPPPPCTFSTLPFWLMNTQEKVVIPTNDVS